MSIAQKSHTSDWARKANSAQFRSLTICIKQAARLVFTPNQNCALLRTGMGRSGGVDMKYPRGVLLYLFLATAAGAANAQMRAESDVMEKEDAAARSKGFDSYYDEMQATALGLDVKAYNERKEKEQATNQAKMPALVVAPTDVPTLKFEWLDKSYGILRGTFTVSNPNPFAVTDPVVECDIVAPSGTVINQYRFTVYERILANGHKTIKSFEFGLWPQQGKSLSCATLSAQRG